MKTLLLSVCLGLLLPLNAYSQSKLINAGKAAKVGGTTVGKSSPTPSKSTVAPRTKTTIRQDPDARYAVSGYMEISGVSFANVDKEMNIIDDYGAHLYVDEIKYLSPKVFYKGLASSEKQITLYIKIINETGIISRGTSSPDGYTYKYDLNVKSGSGQSEQLSAWGNNNGGTYSAGQYKYEIWYNGNILFQKGIRLYPGSAPLVSSKIFKANRILFANKDEASKILSDFGNPLYAGEVKYLTPKLYYNGLCATDQNITLFFRIFEPSGSLSRGDSSPIGFTSKRVVTIKPGENNVELAGWGNKDASYYIEGVYRYELWLDGEKNYETTFTIQKREADNGINLTVDGKIAVSTSFEVSGGKETFFIKTNASSWDVWGVPSWCEVKNKTATSFTLECKFNSAAARKDYMKVRAGGKEVRIDISQE